MGLCKKCVEVRLVGERQLSLTPNPPVLFMLFSLHHDADADVQSRSSPRLAPRPQGGTSWTTSLATRFTITSLHASRHHRAIYRRRRITDLQARWTLPVPNDVTVMQIFVVTGGLDRRPGCPTCLNFQEADTVIEFADPRQLSALAALIHPP